MYGRLFTLQIKPGRMDDLIKLWHEEMVPLARSQPGWLNARLLVDRESGKAVVVGMWASAEEALASGAGSAHADRQRTLLGELISAPPIIETLEVAGDL